MLKSAIVTKSETACLVHSKISSDFDPSKEIGYGSESKLRSAQTVAISVEISSTAAQLYKNHT